MEWRLKTDWTAKISPIIAIKCHGKAETNFMHRKWESFFCSFLVCALTLKHKHICNYQRNENDKWCQICMCWCRSTPATPANIVLERRKKNCDCMHATNNNHLSVDRFGRLTRLHPLCLRSFLFNRTKRTHHWHKCV